MSACPGLEMTLATNASIREFARVLAAGANSDRWLSPHLIRELKLPPGNRYAPYIPTLTSCRAFVQTPNKSSEWPICSEHRWMRSSAADCLVYSFAIANDWAFDDMAAGAGLPF